MAVNNSASDHLSLDWIFNSKTELHPKFEINHLTKILLDENIAARDKVNEAIRFIILFGDSNDRDILIPTEINYKLQAYFLELSELYVPDSKAGEILKLGKYMLSEVLKYKRFSYTTKSHLTIAIMALRNIRPSLSLQNYDLIYPRVIHLETIAICNARCQFCDYGDLNRQGSKMSSEMIQKILNELAAIPKDRMFTINPYRISEPFLDNRVMDICEQILRMHPLSRVCIISNGNYLPQKIIDHLLSLGKDGYFWGKYNDSIFQRLMLTFSLNESNARDYKELMSLDLDRTCRNLDHLHDLTKQKKLKIPVELSRVSTDARKDLMFFEFCKARYPLFPAKLLKLNDWTGTNDYSNRLNENWHIPIMAYKKQPCHRWFDLTILADGKIGLCCMDSGKIDHHIGDAFNQNVLTIYRHKMKKFLPDDLNRGSTLQPCKGCTYSAPIKIKKYNNMS